MNCASKLTNLKRMLNIDLSDASLDSKLEVYLEIAHDEILNWMYINYGNVPKGAEMPSKYDVTQVQAVLAGFAIEGGEGEFKHTENGIVREFQYSNMLDFIRAHVYQLLR